MANFPLIVFLINQLREHTPKNYWPVLIHNQALRIFLKHEKKNQIGPKYFIYIEMRGLELKYEDKYCRSTYTPEYFLHPFVVLEWRFKQLWYRLLKGYCVDVASIYTKDQLGRVTRVLQIRFKDKHLLCNLQIFLNF